MIDVFNEDMISVSELPKSLPGSIHISTVFRWMKRGCRGIRLETVRIGGLRYTSKQAVLRFIEETTAVADGEK